MWYILYWVPHIYTIISLESKHYSSPTSMLPCTHRPCHPLPLLSLSHTTPQQPSAPHLLFTLMQCLSLEHYTLPLCPSPLHTRALSNNAPSSSLLGTIPMTENTPSPRHTEPRRHSPLCCTASHCRCVDTTLLSIPSLPIFRPRQPQFNTSDFDSGECDEN